MVAIFGSLFQSLIDISLGISNVMIKRCLCSSLLNSLMIFNKNGFPHENGFPDLKYGKVCRKISAQ